MPPFTVIYTMAECPVCRRSYARQTACGLRLFCSENECVICLEKKDTMVALPCGHQFCEEDLARIGISIACDAASAPTRRHTPVPTPPMLAAAPVAPAPWHPTWPSSRIQALRRQRLGRGIELAGGTRIIDLTHTPQTQTPQRRRAGRVRRRRVTRTRKRCGWCGHIGHTVKKCPSHARQCGCTTYKSAGHRMQWRSKHKCVVCHKRGHAYQTCANIVKGISR